MQRQSQQPAAVAAASSSLVRRHTKFNFTVTFALRTFDFEVNSVFLDGYEVDVELWLS